MRNEKEYWTIKVWFPGRQPVAGAIVKHSFISGGLSEGLPWHYLTNAEGGLNFNISKAQMYKVGNIDMTFAEAIAASQEM